jgi:hypothetical protein
MSFIVIIFDCAPESQVYVTFDREHVILNPKSVLVVDVPHESTRVIISPPPDQVSIGHDVLTPMEPTDTMVSSYLLKPN